MKKLLFSLIFVAFALGVNAQQGNVIKTNPIGMAFGNFNLTYEKTLGTTSSVLISGYYWYKLFSVDVNNRRD